MHDLLRANDTGVQVDIAILDFSKAFDIVPHKKLLHKLEEYGVRGNSHKWLTSFLQERHMNVVVEGEHSESAPVESDVPQGTVLGPLMFLCHINDLPDAAKSQFHLFADGCLLYRQIKSLIGHKILQDDLNELEKQAENGDMRFNAKQMLHFVRQAKILTILPVKQRNITTSQLKSISSGTLTLLTFLKQQI